MEESLWESDVSVFVLLKELTTEMGPALPAPSATFVKILAGCFPLLNEDPTLVP